MLPALVGFPLYPAAHHSANVRALTYEGGCQQRVAAARQAALARLGRCVGTPLQMSPLLAPPR